RVYLIYGEPSEIDRYPNQTDSRPYEIWSYQDIEGGVIFIFADLTGFSDYLLIHSTKRGELRDDSWERRIMVR
ncbi:MAG: GWxTD domain-containing protein, partial [Ignavibacterium sp.]